jgi:hypothetical protein
MKKWTAMAALALAGSLCGSAFAADPPTDQENQTPESQPHNTYNDPAGGTPPTNDTSIQQPQQQPESAHSIYGWHRAEVDRAALDSLISSWPSNSRQTAQAMVNKYGEPQEATSTMLIWNDNGPWKKTIVYKDGVPHNFPSPHTDVLQQFVAYKVPADKVGELNKFDGSIVYDRTRGWLSVNGPREDLNVLSLNEADQIISGKKTYADARTDFAKNSAQIVSGKSVPESQKFAFEQPMAGTADPDQPVGVEGYPSQPGKTHTESTPSGAPREVIIENEGTQQHQETTH